MVPSCASPRIVSGVCYSGVEAVVTVYQGRRVDLIPLKYQKWVKPPRRYFSLYGAVSFRPVAPLQRPLWVGTHPPDSRAHAHTRSHARTAKYTLNHSDALALSPLLSSLPSEKEKKKQTKGSWLWEDIQAPHRLPRKLQMVPAKLAAAVWSELKSWNGNLGRQKRNEMCLGF